MKRSWIVLNLSLALLLALGSVVPAAAKGETTGYQTGFTLWRGTDFSDWTLSGIVVSPDGTLALDYANATPGTDPYAPGAYNGGNYYNGGSFWVGEAVSPLITPSFAVKEAIASWNAATPAGTWVETQVRAQIAGTRYTKWYSLGVWASGTETVERHSVNLQGDTDGFVAVDTWVRSKSKQPVTGLQVKVRMFSETGTAVPTLKSLGLTYSTEAPNKVTPSTGNPANWGTLINVPECSQMVYPDGGEVWCSPTSTSMVLGYFGYNAGDCEPRVRDAVEGVYDWVYDGHGNWPFNTAYAAAETNFAREGYVRRYTSLTDVEPWVKAGVPVIFSFAWSKGDLDGAAIPSSNGHLAVIVGFDAQGNPIVNDPAAAADADVQRTYNRAQLETQWLTSSGGTVYLIVPAGSAVP